jgi:large subunit ribosomal protein L15
MITLSTLKNTHAVRKNVQRVGRGIGSKRGKTCCRGGKGATARRGSKIRAGYEGGQLVFWRKLPKRGFAHGMFAKDVHSINLSLIDQLYKDGETVNLVTLREKGYAPREAKGGLKILSEGELKKKVTIEAHAFSKGAIAKLEKAKVAFKQISKTDNS